MDCERERERGDRYCLDDDDDDNDRVCVCVCACVCATLCIYQILSTMDKIWHKVNFKTKYIIIIIKSRC